MEILSNSSMATFNNEEFVQNFEQSLILTAASVDSEYSQNFDASVMLEHENNSETQNNNNNKKKRRRQRRRNGNNNGCARIDSPSTESSCSSLASSMTTMSSGICSSIGSSMQTLNEIIISEEKNNFSSLILPPSAPASSIDCNESGNILVEEFDEAFSECSSFTCPIKDTVVNLPKKKSKRKGKKPSQNLKNHTVIQQYFNQQKQFYLQIYEQQFAVLSALKTTAKPEDDEISSKKRLLPHQHLGLPPMPPPSTGFVDSSSMEEFLASMGACEDAYLNQIKQSHSTTILINNTVSKNIDVSMNNNNNNNTTSVSSSASEESVKYDSVSCDDATLSQSILETYENISQSEKTLIRKLRLRDLLYYAIVQAFPTCGLYVVGSSLNGFGNEASDMDLCLVLTNGELDQQTAAVQYLLIVQQILSTLPAIKEQTLIRAKVPILRIRLQGPFAEMVVDLNANNSVAVRNTHLLCYYAFFDYRVRPLVLLVKEWAKQKDINDSTRSSFTSYSLVLMVLHYLQVLEEPVLPSLQQLFPKRFHGRNDIRTLNLSHPLEEIPSESNFKGTNISSLGTLLIGFFDYYAHEYNYDTNAISIRLGREVQRCDVLHGTNTFWGPICIEEPFTRSNTAHSIYDERVFNTIKQKFQDAYEILSSTFDLNKLITIPPPLTPTVSLTDEQYYSHQTGFFQQH